MKFIKFLTVLAISTVATSLFAANTAKAYITFATVPATVGGDVYSDDVKLFEDDEEVLNNIDVWNNISDYCVNAYAVYESTNYCKVKIADLNGLVIKFKANNHAGNYKMTFASISGKVISLKRSDVDTTIVADESNSYNFTCTANQEITFTVMMPYIRPVTAGQWGTICYPKSITSVTGGTLYSLTNATATVVNAELATLPTTAGKAYVFKADAAATQLVMANTGDEASLQTTHGLVGTFEDTTTPAGAYGIMGNYVVEVKEGNALLANRAYIKMSDLTSPTAPKRGHAIFMISNTPTGMELIDAETAKDCKMMINGQLIIIRDGKMFNAQGAAL